MIERIPRFSLRALLLATTLIALVIYFFTTLGMLSGLSAIVFSVAFFEFKTKKARVGVVIVLLLYVLIFTEIGQRSIRSTKFHWNGKACVSILITGRDFKRREEVYLLLKSEIKNADVFPKSEVLQPFFLAAYIALYIKEEQLEITEAEVRRLIEESFPDLSVEIESHSALEDAD